MKRVFSGIKPSGDLHIGNYLGAIINWVKEQDKKENIFCIVDLHAITKKIPKDLSEKTFDLLAWFIACGLDPQKSIIFIQSQNLHHAQLCWILNSFIGVGQLERMTQYKDEKIKFKDSFIPAGLLNYPVLMTADILLYDADEVPVGEDQKQHVELCRDIADRLNSQFPNIVRKPQFVSEKITTRIMNLVNIDKKMGKSDNNPNDCIYMKDDADTISKKIQSATTDSEKNISYTDSRPAIKNLIDIYSGFSGLTPDQIVNIFDGKGYKEFKKNLADVIIDKLTPIQKKFFELKNDKQYLLDIMKVGLNKATNISTNVLNRITKAIGFVSV